MQARKRIAALLTSTSMMALSVAAVPAFAATYSGSRQNLYLGSSDTYVYLDSTFDASGDVVLFDDVGPGVTGLDANSGTIGLLVDEDASIAGKLAVVSGAALTASATGGGQQVATALRAEGTIGRIVNNGLISAYASASDATATATAYGVIHSVSGTGGSGSVLTSTMKNNGTISAVATANATSGSGTAKADASAEGVYQYLYAEKASSYLTNNGDITAEASAVARGTSVATASAEAYGVYQYMYGNGSADSDTTASLTNNGDIHAHAFASASASDSESVYAQATARAVYQYAYYGQTSLATLDNGGHISATATAKASGNAYDGDTGASANASAVLQYAYGDQEPGSTATAFLTNTGTIEANALATGSDGSSGVAEASADAYGVYQYASYGDTLTATLENSGDISASAKAYANGFGSATKADASATAYAVEQYAYANGSGGSSVTASLANSGDIDATAFASADSEGGGQAVASANAYAAYQYAYGTPLTEAMVDNSGDLTAHATAEAHGGSSSASGATASASADGLVQYASGNNSLGSSATVSLTNTGDITAFADASASQATVLAKASADAYGVYQYAATASTLLASVDNSGDIYASARAEAHGSSGAEASAYAYGLYQGGSGGSLTADLDNSGDIDAYAYALADGSGSEAAAASAVGYLVRGPAATVLDATNSGSISATAVAIGDSAKATAVGVEVTAGALTGTLTNSGDIYATALASGASDKAAATGVLVKANVNGVTISNSGIISAYARGTGSTPTVTARGIVIADYGTPVGGTTATIENDGGFIFAGYSTDGGTTLLRGTAIDTTGAPNAVVIDLQGNNPDSYADGFMARRDGAIFGDIDISADDTINVTNGKTGFDGVINPDEVLEGTLDIYDGGWFGLANRQNGPSNVFVDTFTNEFDGTIAFELTGSNASGDYPVITANTANLAGTLEVRFVAGLYGDSTTFYDNVIDANSRNGTFDDVVSSPLMGVTVIYDNADNVDLGVTRVAFDDAAGLTRNQRSVGGGIEDVYGDIDPYSDFGTLVANLFTLDGDGYAAQLDALGGAEFPQYLQSVLTSTSDLERSLADRMGGVASGGAGADPVANASPVPVGSGQLWGYLRGGKDTLDGDDEAPGYDGDRYSAAIGADWAMSNRFFIGAAAAYFKEDLSFDSSDNTIDYEGGQVAIYGGYDDMQQYVRGMVAYGFYDGDSTRYVTPVPNGPRDRLTGSPDSDIFSVSAEIGKRFDIGSGVVATPFLGGRYASANLDGFTEDDPDGSGAALNVGSSDAQSLTSVVGARLTADWAMGSGVFRPQVSAAWVHEFDDTYQTVDMSFASAPAGGGFTIIGSDVSRDSLLLSIGGSYEWTRNMQVSVNYDGLFNSDYTSQSVTGRLAYKF